MILKSRKIWQAVFCASNVMFMFQTETYTVLIVTYFCQREGFAINLKSSVAEWEEDGFLKLGLGLNSSSQWYGICFLESESPPVILQVRAALQDCCEDKVWKLGPCQQTGTPWESQYIDFRWQRSHLPSEDITSIIWNKFT